MDLDGSLAMGYGWDLEHSPLVGSAQDEWNGGWRWDVVGSWAMGIGLQDDDDRYAVVDPCHQPTNPPSLLSLPPSISPSLPPTQPSSQLRSHPPSTSPPLQAAEAAMSAKSTLLTEEEARQLRRRVEVFRMAHSGMALDEGVLSCLLCGVAAHHAGMLPLQKALVETLFQANLLKASGPPMRTPCSPLRRPSSLASPRYRFLPLASAVPCTLRCTVPVSFPSASASTLLPSPRLTSLPLPFHPCDNNLPPFQPPSTLSYPPLPSRRQQALSHASVVNPNSSLMCRWCSQQRHWLQVSTCLLAPQ